MKILVVIGAYLPSTAYGGPIISTHESLKAMAAAGAKILVLTTDADGTRRVAGGASSIDGVDVRYHRARPLNRHGVSPGLWRAIWDEVPRHEVVHAHGTTQLGTTVALWAALRHRKPIVISPHGALMAWGRRRKAWLKRAYWTLDALPARRALFVATSPAEASEMQEVGITRVAVVQNGVDQHRFRAFTSLDVRARLGLAPDARLVSWVGRFDPVKNVEAVIDATRDLGAHLLLGGDPSTAYGAAMVRRVAATGRKDVHFLGYVDGELKTAILQQAQAFVSASFMESYGMAIAEALAAGCPVVVSRAAPWREVEEAGAGYWVEPTPRELGAALRRVLEAGDEQRERARRLATLHSWDARAATLLGIYRDLVGRHPPREAG